MLIPGGHTSFGQSPDGKYIAVGGADGSVFVFSVEDGQFVDQLTDGHTQPVLSAAWDPS